MSTASRSRFASDSKVSHETLIRFDNFARLLAEWNPRINLVSPSTLDNVWERHFLDSAQIYPLLPDGTQRLVDLGSGAGFPGLVLGLLGVPSVHLIESDQRKSVFLREVSRVTDSYHVTIHTQRIEKVESLQADVVTSRALAPLEKLIPLALRHLKPEGVCVFLKGGDAQKEIDLARETCSFTCETIQSVTRNDGVVLRLSDIRMNE